MEEEHAKQQLAMSELANKSMDRLHEAILRKDHDFAVVSQMHNEAVDKFNKIAMKLAKTK